MYSIYKIYNKSELLYVGKTIVPYKRTLEHLLEAWKKEISHIEISNCKSIIDMDIYEKYYINIIKTKYNKKMVYNESPTFKIEQLTFKRYEIKEFIETYRPKNDVNKISLYEKRKNEMYDRIKNSIAIEKGEKIDFNNLISSSYYWYNKINEIEFLQIRHGKYGIVLLKFFFEEIKNNQLHLINGNYELNFKMMKSPVTDNEIFEYLKSNHYLRLNIDNYTIHYNKISISNTWISICESFKVNLDNPNYKHITFYLSKNIIETDFSTYFNY